MSADLNSENVSGVKIRARLSDKDKKSKAASISG